MPQNLGFRYGCLFAIVADILLLSAHQAPAFSEENTDLRIKAKELVSKGMALNDGSDEEERLYLDAFELDATYGEPLFNLGLVYVDRRDYEIAKTYFEQYAELSPKNAKATYMIGLCLDGLGNRPEAAETFTQYLSVAEELSSDLEEQKYVSIAKKALERLTGGKAEKSDGRPAKASSVASYVAKVATTFADQMSVDEIAGILKRPRTRAVPPLDQLSTARFQNIEFRKDSAELLPESRATLEKVAQAIQRDDVKSYHIAIHGHTSTEGTDEHNLALSEARAHSVMEYLVGQGISQERLETKGFGEKAPLHQNDSTEEQRRQNRRVEFSGDLQTVGSGTATTGLGPAPE